MSVLDDILAEEEAANKPPKPRENVVDKISGVKSDPGTWSKISNLLTGDDRQTRATNELSSLAEVGVSGLLPKATMSQKGTIALGLTIERDPQKQLNIIRSNYDGQVGAQVDEAGNILVSIDNAKPVLLNRPGISKMDLVQTGAEMATFAPAANAGGFVYSSLAGGATQALLEAASSLTGSKGSFIDAGIDTVTTGALFGAFNKMFEKLGPLAAPVIAAIKNNKVTSTIKDLIGRSAEDSGVNKIAGEAGLTPEEVTEVFIRNAGKAADDTANPAEAGALALEREFNAPVLTQGQRSGNQSALREEDSMRAGLRGETAENIMLDAEKKAQQRLTNVSEDIKSELGRGSPTISTRQEAGSAVSSGIVRAERTADNLVSDAYAEVGDAALKPEGYKSLLNATRNAVRSPEFVTDEALAPATKSLLDSIKQGEKSLARLEKRKGTSLKPVDIRNIEVIKRRMNALEQAAANPTDRRNIVTMKRAFEKSLDDSVVKMLFDGDDEALAALRTARGVAADYFKKFTAQEKRTRSGKPIPDKPGRFIEQIVEANPTDEQVINSLFTANSFNNLAGPKMARKYKEILGPDSDEWNMVRQAGFINFVRTNTVNGVEVISGQRSLKALNNAIKQNDTLVRELYTSSEIAKMRRFFSLVKKTKPDLTKSGQNPSGSGIVALNEGWKAIRSLMMTTGDVSTAGVMVMLREITGKIMAPRRAKEAIRPFKAQAEGLKSISGPSAAVIQEEGQ